MTGSDKQDHWNSLASLLGAIPADTPSPPPAAPVAQKTPASQSPPPAPAPVAKTEPPAPKIVAPPAPPDPKWSAAEQASYVPGKDNLMFVSAHEVWPGHFLQFLHSNRAQWKFGQLFVGYAFAEGWAHYCEEMMFDAGLGDGNPEAHIGQLTNALLRDVRFLSAIGLHTGGMSVADSEKMFRDKGLQNAGQARQQAARGTFDPAYLNYTLGKLMIMQLREDWTAAHGGRAGWKGFHDQFLSYGGPPIPLVRAQMLGGAPVAALWHPSPAKPSATVAPATP